MLFTVVGVFRDSGKPWACTINTQGIYRAACEGKVRIMIEHKEALPPGSYRDNAARWEHKDNNTKLVAVIPGNHVVRLAGEGALKDF